MRTPISTVHAVIFAAIGVLGMFVALAGCGSMRGSIGTIYVLNKTTQDLWCNLTVDGGVIPCGALGPGGEKGAFMGYRMEMKAAHLRLIDMSNKDQNTNHTDVEVDLTNAPGDGADLHLEILSMHDVKSHFSNGRE